MHAQRKCRFTECQQIQYGYPSCKYPGHVYSQLKFPVWQFASILERKYRKVYFQYGCDLPNWKFELEISRLHVQYTDANSLSLGPGARKCPFCTPTVVQKGVFGAIGSST